MERCCVKGCDSHQNCNDAKRIDLFRFPLHDEILLKKWLRQIDLLNWTPSSYHRICSMHFREQDFVTYNKERRSFLKLTSIPTIFPTQPVEIMQQNETTTSCPTIPLHSQLGNIVNVVGCNSLLPTQPLIIIPSGQFPQQISGHYPIELVAQNLKQNFGDDSMVLISSECIKNVGAESSSIIMNNSIKYIQQMQRQKTPADQWHIKPIDTESCSVITNNGVRTNENLVQTPIQYAQQVVTLPISPANNEQQMKQEHLTIVEPPSSQSNFQPRLRKILPKPETFNPDTLPAKIVPNGSNSSRNLLPKPDVLIVPRIETGKASVSRYPGNKKPILRVTIYKECGSQEATPCLPDQEGKRRLRSDDRLKTGAVNSLQSEMTIENSSTNKAVTFKLDSTTGEIVASTRPLDDSIKDRSASNSTQTERKLDDNTIPAPPKVSQRYIKGKQECIELRKKLRELRQRHRQEQEEIERLQRHLTALGDKVENICSDDSLTLLSVKRKEGENSRVQIDENESSLSQVKKIKHELQTDAVILETEDFTEKKPHVINYNNGELTSPKAIKPFIANRKLRRSKNS